MALSLSQTVSSNESAAPNDDYISYTKEDKKKSFYDIKNLNFKRLKKESPRLSFFCHRPADFCASFKRHNND